MNPHKTRPSRFFRSPLSLSLSLSLLIVGLLSATVIPPEELEANKPRILQTKSGNSLLLDWAAQPEVYYFMEASPDLSTWASAKLLKDNAETGTLSLGTTISSDKAFFRLSLEGDPSSARLRADDDGDKIINLLEADADMDAFKTEASVDSDGDEIPDYWEQFHFGTLVHDASYVAITDGLTLDEAFAASTDPTKLDSDGDGWSDALELIWGWDPNYDQGRDDDKYSYLGDFDGDGINNGTELLNETNASDSADAPPSPPKFAVIDLGEVSDNQIKDLANNGWTLIRKNNGDFHRWHWGIEEALSPSIEDSHCAAINSSGIVVGEAEDLTSEAWIYNAVYWPTNSSSYTILPPANPDEDNGIWQGIHDITDSNKIGGRGFLQLSGVNTGSGMTGQLETGFDHELGSLSRGGSPDYKLNGISYAPDKINDQGSFIGIQRVYQNSSMIEYNAAVSVISGGSPRIHEQVYDINESDMVLAKDVSSPEGALLLADGTRDDLDLWDGEELSAMSSPSNPTDPLIILSNWSIYIQKQVIATDGSASLASIVDKSSFYIYDIWDIFPSSDYYSTSGEQLISPDGTMIATPMYHAPTGETRQLLLLKVDIAVDNNRDGEVEFANVADETTEDEPYRFWLNNDFDTTEVDELPGGATADSSDNEIKTKRDLEDFTRLSFTTDAIQDQLKAGTIELGFKWKDAEGSPSLKLYWSAMSDGSKLYVEDDGEADLQMDTKYKTALGTVSGTTATYVDKKVFESIEVDDKVHFLFEGVSAGKGELVMTLKMNGTESEASGEWIELLPIEKMYQTSNATPTDGFASPLQNTAATPNYPIFEYSIESGFEAAWDEKTNVTVFIHGWRTPAEGARMAAEIMFKRLWWEGYQGRFVYFRWPTLTGLYTYSDSELRAWKYGESLQSFLGSDDIPNGYRKNVVAHSLGNVVVGGAIKRGASMDTYVAMQAAIPAGCYDTNSNDNYFAAKSTPDLADPDKGYRGHLADSSISVINYFNPNDYALVAGTYSVVFFGTYDTNWRKWQRDYKPRYGSLGTAWDGDIGYVYNPTDPSLIARLYLERNRPPAAFDDEILRYIIDNEESMSMIASSKSAALGATSISQNVSVNRDLSLEAFGELTNSASDHSGQFSRPVQAVRLLYLNLIDDLNE